MEYENYFLNRFGQAVQYLPPRLRSVVMQIDDDIKMTSREFRLRAGQPLTITTATKEIEVPSEMHIRHDELNTVIDIATGGSIHTSADSMKNGFVTVSGGHRIGICGTGVMKASELSFIKNISSVSIRIAKECIGVAQEAIPAVTQNGAFENTIIISPPGCGKTTMLRDLIRLLSDGEYAYRISVADERSEIGAKYRGVAQFDIGKHTDIMEGIPKSIAMMLMLRSMSPQILAVDEITIEDDIKAMEYACNCGVSLLATAHGYDTDCLFSRPLYKKLLDLNIFRYAIVLAIKDGKYIWDFVEL